MAAESLRLRIRSMIDGMVTVLAVLATALGRADGAVARADGWRLAAGLAVRARAAWLWVAATSGDDCGPAVLPAVGPDMVRYVPATPANTSAIAATAAQTGRILTRREPRWPARRPGPGGKPAAPMPTLANSVSGDAPPQAKSVSRDLIPRATAPASGVAPAAAMAGGVIAGSPTDAVTGPECRG